MNAIRVKRLIMLHVPTSICNFRCHYCYLGQKAQAYKGLQARMEYSPEQVSRALSVERMGGVCFINSCAEGETLLTKDIDLYYKALVKEGHYIEIVTNLTITPMIEKILSWDRSLLRRVEFKCSFHYLELKRNRLLDVFAANVKKIWDAGASANIEITPSDELVPYIEEVKAFSMEHFGALPHLTIARDDRTNDIVKLTKFSDKEYRETWEQFDSGFWNYKMQIFGKRQEGFCYAGEWSLFVNIANGEAKACYYKSLGNIFKDPTKPIPYQPIGRCPIAHCYNGHAFMTFGLIPGATEIGYGDIRNRVREDGSEWLQPELRDFFNSKLNESNKEWPKVKKCAFLFRTKAEEDAVLIGRWGQKAGKIVKKHIKRFLRVK